eukprot:PhF_6_TR40760/c0_g1_i1/m.61411
MNRFPQRVYSLKSQQRTGIRMKIPSRQNAHLEYHDTFRQEALFLAHVKRVGSLSALESFICDLSALLSRTLFCVSADCVGEVLGTVLKRMNGELNMSGGGGGSSSRLSSSGVVCDTLSWESLWDTVLRFCMTNSQNHQTTLDTVISFVSSTPQQAVSFLPLLRKIVDEMNSCQIPLPTSTVENLCQIIATIPVTASTDPYSSESSSFTSNVKSASDCVCSILENNVVRTSPVDVFHAMSKMSPIYYPLVWDAYNRNGIPFTTPMYDAWTKGMLTISASLVNVGFYEASTLCLLLRDVVQSLLAVTPESEQMTTTIAVLITRSIVCMRHSKQWRTICNVANVVMEKHPQYANRLFQLKVIATVSYATHHLPRPPPEAVTVLEKCVPELIAVQSDGVFLQMEKKQKHILRRCPHDVQDVVSREKGKCVADVVRSCEGVPSNCLFFIIFD